MFLAFIFCCTSPNAAAKAVADKPCACVVHPQLAQSPRAARTRMTRAARRRSWEKKKVSCHLCDLLCSYFFTVHARSYCCLENAQLLSQMLPLTTQGKQHLLFHCSFKCPLQQGGTKLLSISLSPGACADEGQSEDRRSKRTTAGNHPKHDGAVKGKSKRGGNVQKKNGLTISGPIRAVSDSALLDNF